MAYSAGDRVQVRLVDDREFEGVIIPSDSFVLKLDDGYNIGIEEDNISELSVISSHENAQSSSTPTISRDESLPRILILHTGGTIASKVDYSTGGVSNLFSAQELLAMYPQLQEVACVEAEFVANMSSDDMRFDHYNLLIDAITKARSGDYEAIIITHGTDTLHYTGAALHYALQGIDMPVVLVGSQRSSDRGSSDASTNLLAATRYCVSKKRSSGVFICMHDSESDTSAAIFPGVHARKMHTSRRDAFTAINSKCVARVNEQGKVIEVSSPRTVKKFSAQKFDTKLRIGMLYAHPHLYASEIEAYQEFDGLIVLGTGLGHLPISVTDDMTKEHENIKQAIDTLAKKIPVVMGSQCINGRISLQVYSPGRHLQQAGVLGHDLALTPETLFIKLAFLLSTNQDPKRIQHDFQDVVERSQEDFYD